VPSPARSRVFDLFFPKIAVSRDLARVVCGLGRKTGKSSERKDQTRDRAGEGTRDYTIPYHPALAASTENYATLFAMTQPVLLARFNRIVTRRQIA